MNILRPLAIIVLAAAMGAACTTTRAAMPVERPALDVPPVPARLVEPAPLPLAPPLRPEPVGDLPAAPATAGKASAKPSAPPAKPDPKAETPPADPPATPEAQPTVPPLRTPGTSDAQEATRLILAISARAQKIVDKTDPGSLNRERRAQFEHTKLLISQAADAIKAANFEFARNLAEKAEKLAKELQGR